MPKNNLPASKQPGGLKNKPNLKNKKPANFLSSFSLMFLIFLAVLMMYSYYIDGGVDNKLAVSDLAKDVRSGKIEKILVDGNYLMVTYKEAEGKKDEKKVLKEITSSVGETLASYGVTSEEISQVKIEIKEPSGWSIFLMNYLPIILPLVFLILLAFYFLRQVRGAGMQAFTFGQTTARFISPKDGKQKVTFADVAGAKEAKQELYEIVDFLKSPKKFLDIGARIPKGILLMGAPGTGKTLLARATAGEAGVSFFSISGSEFVEMFVGVGASRVRDLFKVAKTAAPSIIFIDEIDAVGRTRGIGLGGGNDEREQTLNQILVEMDGFEPNEKIIVMAATNRPDVLDPAILRPGRFDRRVIIDLPDRNDREDILKVHSKGKPLAEDVNLRVLAERTPGFSGADLYSLVNEGAILAAREGRNKVAQFDLIRAIEKVMLGPERKSHLLSKKEKEITAYHEAGHAVVSSVLPYADPVHKISIISRGRAAGYTLKLPIEDRKLQSRKEFLDDIAVSLGGIVAEKMIFDDTTTGPSNDLQVSTSLARDMVTKYGMSEKLGPMAFEGQSGRSMFGRGLDGSEYSEKVGAEIDAEVKHILDSAYKKAEKILHDHHSLLDAVAKRLIEAETIEREEYEKIIIAHGISLKEKKDIEHQ